MCFSASASFSAGVVLSVIGVAAIKKVRRPSQLMFAAIPLIFAVQQISEGFLWISLPHASDGGVQVSFTYTFLFFAEILWPVWVPVAIFLLEKDSSLKTVHGILVGAGLLVGCYLGYCLFTYPVQASIVGQHISYKLSYPVAFRYYGIGLYALATIVPPFLSSVKRMWMLGVAIFISCIISVIFYEHYILSVWCFFASVISISIYAIMREINSPASVNSSLSADSIHICRA